MKPPAITEMSINLLEWCCWRKRSYSCFKQDVVDASHQCTCFHFNCERARTWLMSHLTCKSPSTVGALICTAFIEMKYFYDTKQFHLVHTYLWVEILNLYVTRHKWQMSLNKYCHITLKSGVKCWTTIKHQMKAGKVFFYFSFFLSTFGNIFVV